MTWRKLRLALVAAGALGLAGCQWWYYDVPSPDALMHAIPWFDHMITARYIHPYQTAAVPRETPPGSVPITGAEVDYEQEWAVGNTTHADRLVNPFAGGDSGAVAPPGPDVPTVPETIEARGDTMFHTYCSVCHGQDGSGNGLVGVKLGAPSLLTARARAFSDGYIYSIIRYGRGIMPRYGDKIYAPIDRWAIVEHVRKLQQQAPAPAGGAQ
jgi:mono/diheme cytochrome c family protein